MLNSSFRIGTCVSTFRPLAGYNETHLAQLKLLSNIIIQCHHLRSSRKLATDFSGPRNRHYVTKLACREVFELSGSGTLATGQHVSIKTNYLATKATKIFAVHETKSISFVTTGETEHPIPSRQHRFSVLTPESLSTKTVQLIDRFGTK